VNREREEKERLYYLVAAVTLLHPLSLLLLLALHLPRWYLASVQHSSSPKARLAGGVVLIQMWTLKIISNRVRCGASVGGLSKRNAIATDAGWLRSTSRTRREECRLGVSQLQRPCSEQKYRWAGVGWAPRNAGAHKAPPMQLNTNSQRCSGVPIVLAVYSLASPWQADPSESPLDASEQ